MVKIYTVSDLSNKKYNSSETYNLAVNKCVELLETVNGRIISGSLFGAAARGDFKRGSDVDMIIISKDEYYHQTSKLLNELSLQVRDELNTPLDIHFHKESSINNGKNYYDDSFISHLVSDCPENVKYGKPIEEIIVPGWSAEEAVKARILLAKLDLSRLEAGFDYHYLKQDSYLTTGLEKLFSRTQHTTRNILYIKGKIEQYTGQDKTKKAFLDLYLETFENTGLAKIEKEIRTAENKYYDVLEKTITSIEQGKPNMGEYTELLKDFKRLIPLATNFYDINLDLIK